MKRVKSLKSYSIGPKIRALRLDRHWTQAELAKELDLSQARLSELERGDGSFTAEQLLDVLRLFNVPIDHFASRPTSLGPSLQNALARLGAPHLRESTEILPSERLTEVHDVLREVLLSAESPRLITALAPVLISNADSVSLNRLWVAFREHGLEGRVGWLVEETFLALQQRGEPPPAWSRHYRRAAATMSSLLSVWKPARSSLSQAAPDILDSNLRSAKTIADVQRSASDTARSWNIVTAIRTDDFVEALRAAHEAS
jgi:transcriptional regulator with XRE-family HTH domain